MLTRHMGMQIDCVGMTLKLVDEAAGVRGAVGVEQAVEDGQPSAKSLYETREGFELLDIEE